MNEYIHLTAFQISLSAGFVIAAGVISVMMRLGLITSLFIASVRTVVQLSLAGAVLGFVFGLKSMWIVLLLALMMMLLAWREAIARQKFKIRGTGLDVMLSLSLSSLLVSVTVTGVIISARPFWTPHIFVPLLGMILGNTLTGISLALDRFISDCKSKRKEIEDRLLLGANPIEATLNISRNAIRTGMMPMINSMSIVGIVSFPGMMTGQLLAGADPKDAVMYQIVVMFMLVGSTAFGSLFTVWLTRRRLFNNDMALVSSLYENGS